MIILEQIFHISITESPKNRGLIFMGKYNEKEYFSIVKTYENKFSPLFKNKNSRIAYDDAKDWFNSQFDGFLELKKASLEEFQLLSKDFIIEKILD